MAQLGNYLLGCLMQLQSDVGGATSSGGATRLDIQGGSLSMAGRGCRLLAGLNWD